MADLNSSLTNILSPPKIWVYTDGSAVAVGPRTGSYAAVVMFPGGQWTMVSGLSSYTSIDRMELLAINEALYFIRQTMRNIVQGESVHVICDRENIVRSATGRYKRHANLDLWAQFDEVARNFDLSIQHSKRNETPAQAQCDSVCDILRDEFIKILEKITKLPEYAELRMTRTTVLPEDLEEPESEPADNPCPTNP